MSKHIKYENSLLYYYLLLFPPRKMTKYCRVRIIGKWTLVKNVKYEGHLETTGSDMEWQVSFMF
jgi:hypothetical protein